MFTTILRRYTCCVVASDGMSHRVSQYRDPWWRRPRPGKTQLCSGSSSTLHSPLPLYILLVAPDTPLYDLNTPPPTPNPPIPTSRDSCHSSFIQNSLKMGVRNVHAWYFEFTFFKGEQETDATPFLYRAV